MKFSFIYICIFITFFSCSDQGPGKNDPLEAVKMVEKWPGCDTLEYEPGIDPVPSKKDTLLQIMWHSHSEGSRLSEFRVYRSVEPDGKRRYSQIGAVKVLQANAQDSTYLDANVDLYQRYSYYVTAIADDGVESLPSDTVWYVLTDEANLLKPTDQETIVQTPITFEWDYSSSSGINPDEYILRIEQYWDDNYHPLVFVKIVTAEFGGINKETVGGDWVKSNVTGVPYRWRVDCIGSEELKSGSESNWKLFYLNLN